MEKNVRGPQWKTNCTICLIQSNFQEAKPPSNYIKTSEKEADVFPINSMFSSLLMRRFYISHSCACSNGLYPSSLNHWHPWSKSGCDLCVPFQCLAGKELSSVEKGYPLLVQNECTQARLNHVFLTSENVNDGIPRDPGNDKRKISVFSARRMWFLFACFPQQI